MTHIIEFPFHIGDFLTGTLHMDAQEKGAYVMLILAHMQAGVQGLPDDDKKLARITGTGLKTWKKIRPVIEEKFDVTEGFWCQKRCIQTILNISQKSAVAKANVLKRWEAHHTDAYANHKPITNRKKEGTNVPSKEIEPSEGLACESPDENFETFWASYPRQRRGSRTKAEGAWRTAARRAEPQEILEGLRRYATSDEVARGFAKGAAAWLNDDRWTVDYTPPRPQAGKPDPFLGRVEATRRGLHNVEGGAHG